MWADDKQHGFGTLARDDGSVYTGEWHANQKHGHAAENYEDGSKYEGEFKMGLKHGQGVFTYPDGASYSGGWIKDKQDGHGVYTDAEGGESHNSHPWKDFFYEGTRNDVGQPHKFGSADYPDGSRYTGELRDGKRMGFGKQVWPDGDAARLADKSLKYPGVSYEGQWRDDLKHGTGVYKTPNGNVFQGKWVEGQKSGRGEVTYPDGTTFEVWAPEREEESQKAAAHD
jgi:hypothetical protein